MTYLLVFVIAAGLDFLWARYITLLSLGEAWRAATYAAAIVAFGGLVTVLYVRNPFLLIPATLGAFVGTLVGAW